MTHRFRHAWVSLAFIACLAVTAIFSSRAMSEDAPPPWVAPARAARKANPIAVDDKSIAAGKAVYIAQCIKCHGDAGKGDGVAAKDLNPKPRDLSNPAITIQTDGALFWKLTTGQKPMPTFEPLISENDRWNVINFVRTLAPKPASTTQPATQPAAGH